MSFRATRPSAYTQARSIASNLKRLATETKAASLAGPTSFNVILQLFNELIFSKTQLTTIAAVPGLAAYAQAQEGDEAYDVAAEFTAMSNAIDTLRNWIMTNINKDGDDYILVYKLTVNGVTTRTYSTASLAGLRTQIDALIATID